MVKLHVLDFFEKTILKIITLSSNMDSILQCLTFSITYTQLLLTFSAVVPVDRNVFTCVQTSVGGRIQADALQVIVATLFMLLK